MNTDFKVAAASALQLVSIANIAACRQNVAAANAVYMLLDGIVSGKLIVVENTNAE